MSSYNLLKLNPWLNYAVSISAHKEASYIKSNLYAADSVFLGSENLPNQVFYFQYIRIGRFKDRQHFLPHYIFLGSGVLTWCTWKDNKDIYYNALHVHVW